MEKTEQNSADWLGNNSELLRDPFSSYVQDA